MPVIREYRSQTQVAGPIGGRRATAADLGGGALSGAGEGLMRVADAMQRRHEQAEISDLNAKMAETQAQWSVHLQETLRTAQPGDPEISDRFLTSFDEHTAKLGESIETDAGREYFNRQTAALRGNFLEKSAAGQAALAGVKIKQDYAVSLNNYSSSLVSDPDSFDMTLAMHDEALEGMVAAGLSTSAIAELKTKGAAELANSAVNGGIDQDPYKALSDLNSGRWDTFIDGSLKATLVNRAETEIRRLEAEDERLRKEAKNEARADVALFMQDELTSIEANGKPVGLVTPELINKAFPDEPKKADRLIGQLQMAQDYYVVRQTVALTSPEEDAATLAGLQRDIPGVNAVQAAQQRADYHRAVAEKRQALAEDPFSYVLQTSTSLAAKVRDSADDPEMFRQALAEADQLQAELGVPAWRRGYLGKGAATDAAGRLNAAQPEEAADEIESMATMYGPMWPQVMRELNAAGMNPSFMTLARLSTADDAVVRKDLASALQTGRDVLRKNVTDIEANDIDRQVTAELEEFAATLQQDGRSGQDVLAAETASARALAYLYKQRGMSNSEAASKATAALINNRYDFVDTYRAPKGLGGRVEATAEDVLAGLTPDRFPVARGGDPSLSEDYRRQAAHSYAMQGTWANTPNSDGIELLYPDGSPVLLGDGERVRVMFGNLGTRQDSISDITAP